MATFAWKSATTDEKLEELRVNIQHVVDAMNAMQVAMIDDIGNLRRRVAPIESKLSEVAKAVEALELKRK